MKKTYTTPEVSVVLFENEDIVTNSGGESLIESMTNEILGLDNSVDFGAFGK